MDNDQYGFSSSSSDDDFSVGVGASNEMIKPVPGTDLASYKTILCRFRSQPGGCKKMERCIFAHNTDELRKTTDPVPAKAAKIYENKSKKKDKASSKKSKKVEKETNSEKKVHYIFENNDYIKKQKENERDFSKNQNSTVEPHYPTRQADYDAKSSGYYQHPHYAKSTVFDAVQSPCEFGRISIFEINFQQKIFL